jgi:hypothetical protein
MTMHGTIKIIATVLVVFTTMSFSDKAPSEKVMTGAYGVCNCGPESAAKVELTINDDFTFHYYDNNNPAKIIDVKGNWALNENVILLKDYKSAFAIRDKWTIDKNEKCLKSRKGMEWTRLCHIKSCN